MSSDNEGKSIWHLSSTQRAIPATEVRAYTIGKSISDSRFGSYRSNAAFLVEILETSAFAGLQDRCMGFIRAATVAAQAFQSGQSTRDLTPPIRSKFDDLLSAFRRFVDRTPHSLSQRYGDQSRELAKFREAASYEFNNEFAYRFIYHLRNYSDHRGSPISRIDQSSRLDSNQKVEHSFDVLFNSRTLLRNHDWHRAVREDLVQIDNEFSAIVVADALLQSCGRIQCKILIAQEADISSAIEDIRSLANEAPSGENLGAVLIHIKIQEIVARQPVSPFNVTVIRTDLADVAEAALRQARALVGS